MVFAIFLLLTVFMLFLYRLISRSGVMDRWTDGTLSSKRKNKTNRIAKILDLVERDWISTKNVSINKKMKMDSFYWYMKARKESYFYDIEYGFCDEYEYSFENGYKLRYYVGDDRCRIVLLDRSNKKISEIDVKKTKDVAVELLNKIKDIRYVCNDIFQTIGRHEYREEYNHNQRAYSGYTQSSSTETKKDEYSDLDPKKADKLRKLDEKIKLRQEQINRMPKGSERESLENELENYKRARQRIFA